MLTEGDFSAGTGQAGLAAATPPVAEPLSQAAVLQDGSILLVVLNILMELFFKI